jgi:hypothetical protein
MTQEAVMTLVGLLGNAALLTWLITMIMDKPSKKEVDEKISNRVDSLGKDILVIKTFMSDIYIILKKDIPSYLKE